MTQENILVWNCRGIVCNETQRALMDLVQMKKPSLIFLAETLAKPSHIDTLMHRLGFSGNACYPHEDSSQGVALIWRNDIHVRVRTSSPHHIDADIGDPGGQARYRFTGIYGFAARYDRNRTWDLIHTLNAERCDLPWLMAGDFNEILCQTNKSGGPPRAAAPLAQFRQVMSDCGLMDMGFFGSRFTWSNKFTKERLDRGFQSLQWRLLYPYSSVITLHPSESDHCPILVEVRAERRHKSRICKRFRFEEMWHGDERCTAIIQKHWSQPTTGNMLFQIGQKINTAGQELLKWHSTEFQHQKAEMHMLQAKMDAIMRQPFSPLQYEEQRQLHVRHSQLLAHQEKYWRQRSKVTWLKDGDRNSAFFHRKASNRKCKNTIKGLLTDNNEWTTDSDEVKQLLLNYYRDIFSTEGTCDAAISEIFRATPLKVAPHMNEDLLRPY